MTALSRLMACTAFGALLIFGLPPASAADPTYTPPDSPGPTLRPSRAALAASVDCSGNFSARKEAVLLIPGTSQTSSSQFSWSWEPALTRAGIPWCAVSPPSSSLGDMTIAGEYDAYAIRKTFALSGHKIAVVGHSQGAMRPRWAFRFFPDTRAMVADFVGLAPPNQGLSLHVPTLPLIDPVCGLTGCPDAVWQFRRGSRYVQALNSDQETFRGIDYSVIYSESDGLVDPVDTPLNAAPGVSYRRVAIQQECPLRIVDHTTLGSTDAVAWAMAMDAITHPGPVDPSRIPPSICRQTLLPGLSALTALQGAATALAHLAVAVATTPRVSSEPRLPCYVFGGSCR